MKINKGFIHREIIGDHVLVPVGSENMKLNGVFPMSETAAAIYELYCDGLEEREIVDRLLQEYEIDRETLTADVHEFTEKLIEAGILNIE